MQPVTEGGYHPGLPVREELFPRGDLQQDPRPGAWAVLSQLLLLPWGQLHIRDVECGSVTAQHLLARSFRRY